MPEPTPLEWLRDIAANGYIMSVSLRDGGHGDLMPEDITAGIEEAVAAEAARWRRIPGTYRTERGTEIVVDLPESLSWLEDEFPEEVAAIEAEARASERARLAEAVWGLPTRTTNRGTWVKRSAVLALLEPADA